MNLQGDFFKFMHACFLQCSSMQNWCMHAQQKVHACMHIHRRMHLIFLLFMHALEVNACMHILACMHLFKCMNLMHTTQFMLTCNFLHLKSQIFIEFFPKIRNIFPHNFAIYFIMFTKAPQSIKINSKLIEIKLLLIFLRLHSQCSITNQTPNIQSPLFFFSFSSFSCT